MQLFNTISAYALAFDSRVDLGNVEISSLGFVVSGMVGGAASTLVRLCFFRSFVFIYCQGLLVLLWDIYFCMHLLFHFVKSFKLNLFFFSHKYTFLTSQLPISASVRKSGEQKNAGSNLKKSPINRGRPLATLFPSVTFALE